MDRQLFIIYGAQKKILPYITATGMLPFGSGFTSDHRPLFIDISLPNFISTTNTKPQGRILYNNNPKKVQKYTSTLRNLFQRTNVEEKIK